MALTRLFVLAALLGVVAGGAVDSAAAPVGTAFTYQGQLKDGGTPANGDIAMIFRLFDGPDSATQIGDDVEETVDVVNGLFTVNLDFGPAAFDGEERWLEVSVDGTPLEPRQPMTPAPYAIHALRSLGATNWLDSGDDVVLPTGNAGIGTDAPTAMLHLQRPYASTGIRFQSIRFDQGAPTSAMRAPGSATNTGTGEPWIDPGAAINGNDVWATTNLSEVVGTPDADQSVFLDLTTAGFSIPPAGEITGITVQVEGRSTQSCSDCSSPRITMTANLLGGSADSSPKGFVFGPSDAVVAVGSNIDPWGLEWTPKEVNGAGFGVRLSANLVVGNQFCGPIGCFILSCDCTGAGTSFIDAVTITVFYFDTPTTSTPFDWSIGIPETGSGLHLSPTADLSNPAIFIDTQGRVGINTTEPGTFDLAVVGFAAKTTGSSWASLSDGRLKKNVEPIAGALDSLLSLRGVSFEFTDRGLATGLASPGRQIGFIAQEVEPVFPDWVGEFNDGYKFITENGSTALLVEALRELRAEKNAQIADRDARIAALEERVRQVESLLGSQVQGDRRER